MKSVSNWPVAPAAIANKMLFHAHTILYILSNHNYCVTESSTVSLISLKYEETARAITGRHGYLNALAYLSNVVERDTSTM